MEYNLVEVWLRKDPVRWFAGLLAGLFAGAVAMGVAMLISTLCGMELWFPAKLVGTTLLGSSATELDSMQGAITGGIIFEAVCMFLGFVYAHFTGTNLLKALLPMGLVWGLFSWIFIWNLFMQSFKPIFAAQVPPSAAFPVCVAYGLALTSVAVFDRILRGNKNPLT